MVAWLTYSKDLHIELMQASEEGKDITGLKEEVQQIQAMDMNDPAREYLAAQLLDRTKELPMRKHYEYNEPSDLQGIRASLPASRFQAKAAPKGKVLYDKLYGAWLGRSAGCLLGQPVEGWKRDRLTGLLRDTGNYPISNYLSSDLPEPLLSKYEITNIGRIYGSNRKNWINNVSHMVEDDDVNDSRLKSRACNCPEVRTAHSLLP